MAGTGRDTKVINVGEMSNKGIELTLNGKILKSENFSWDVNLNFSKTIINLLHFLQMLKICF